MYNNYVVFSARHESTQQQVFGALPDAFWPRVVTVIAATKEVEVKTGTAEQYDVVTLPDMCVSDSSKLW